jgi:hypothetical protein
MCKLFIDIQLDNFSRLAFLLVYQIGVDLSGGNVFMGEHFADRVNFAAARHKQGRECMPETVKSDVLGYACGFQPHR